MKKNYFLAAAVGLFALSAAPAMAFHDGGVAHCDGCHSMHNSVDNPILGTENEALLKGSDASSTCLNCHSGAGSYHVDSVDGTNLKEGGDFGWLRLQYKSGGSRGKFYAGDQAGHNIVAADYGLTTDVANPTAPGSSLAYDSTLLGCTSCHDAHAQVNDGTRNGTLPVSVSGSYAADAPDALSIKGNFRILGDSAYEAGHNTNDGFAFTNDAPVALANGSSGLQTRYASGMSEWCANCHDEYYNNDPDVDAGKHPTSVLLAKDGIDVNYNSYVRTGDFTGVQATSYDDMVPYETGAADQPDNVTSSAGPSLGTEQVMCLSCHRAHASAFNNSTRWDTTATLLAESSSLSGGTFATVAPSGVAYYADGVAVDVVAKYGDEQRGLCNKCHVQD